MKKKTRNGLLVLVLLLTVGFAAVSTTLIINGTAMFNANDEEFDVYYSNALVNGVQDLSVVTDNQTITFSDEMSVLGEKFILDYDVTNGSKNYDAELTMTCTESNDYLKITNEFDTETNLSASQTRSGKITIELIKSYTGDAQEVSITCTINANAVERDTLSTDEPALDAESQYYVGKVVTIAGETFNVISQTDDTVTMLAQYNLGTDYKQTETANKVGFSNANGWEYTPGPKEIDIQSYDGNAKTYVNEYVSYLQTETGTTIISGNLITLTELKALGCTIKDDYSDADGVTCKNSRSVGWLVNGQSWWISSAYTGNKSVVWAMNAVGDLLSNGLYYYGSGIRPVITISKDALQ